MATRVRGFAGLGAAIVSDLKAFDRQRKFATVVALTRTAKAVKDAEVAEMARVFDRPTRYTLNALYVRPATMARPEASVGFKDFAGKGTPAWKYLGPQIEGGARRRKRFETSLARAGLLPQGMFAVPGDAADLDAYGNMARGQIVKILSDLKAFGEVGYVANRRGRGNSRRRRRAERYFVGGFGRARPLPPGIYKRVGDGPAVPVVAYVRAPRYRRRFDFFRIAERTVNATFQREFDRALASALRNAR